MTNQNLPQTTPVNALKKIVNSQPIQERLTNALQDGAGLFTLSIIDLYSSDPGLQKYDPNMVVAECMKAAALKLPITKSLGFAYIVPFKGTPTFTIGYKGLIQLCLRTNQFLDINADAIYEGETVETDRLTGQIRISGKQDSDKPIGYFAYMELKTGFKKAVYWDHERVIEHAKAKSPSYKNKSSAWFTDTTAMCIKTVLRALLSKWAPMSIDFLMSDTTEEPETKDITPPKEDPKNTIVDPDFKEDKEPEKKPDETKQEKKQTKGPDY